MDPNMQGMLANLVNSGCDALDAGDNDLAIELLELPADLGFGTAMFNIAIAYKRRGDLDEAIRWYQAAAEAGDIDAMAYLGWVMQLLGDLDKAADWYGKAVASGHVAAGTRLRTLRADNSSVAAVTVRASGAAMARGHVMNGCNDMAAEGWMLAADAGDPESMVYLGLAAEDRRDRGEAILWHTAAARAGSDQARDWLDEQTGRPTGSSNSRTPAGLRVTATMEAPSAVCNNGHPMDPKNARCTDCGARLRMQWMRGDS